MHWKVLRCTMRPGMADIGHDGGWKDPIRRTRSGNSLKYSIASAVERCGPGPCRWNLRRCRLSCDSVSNTAHRQGVQIRMRCGGEERKICAASARPSTGPGGVGDPPDRAMVEVEMGLVVPGEEKRHKRQCGRINVLARMHYPAEVGRGEHVYGVTAHGNEGPGIE